jgi:ATP-binding cassette ChvD family protein
MALPRGRDPRTGLAAGDRPPLSTPPESASAVTDKKIIFSMVGVSKSYRPGERVLEDIYLSFFHGAKIGVLGLNGAGKSTLLRIIAGVETEYEGEIQSDAGITFGYLPQEPELDAAKTVREVVEEGAAEAVGLLKSYEAISERFAEPDADFDALMTEQGKIQERIDALDAWDTDSKLEMAMDALRCPPGDTSVSVLSGGERRRVALVRLLLERPDVLLLDEPTNHLDAESVAWLEGHLETYPGTVIAVTHDRYFLDNVAGWILELDRGRGIPFEGNYSSWLEQKSARLALEKKQESKRQKALERELDWVRQNPKGRSAKSKARIANYERMVQEGVEARHEEREIVIAPGPRLGDVVIEADDVAKSFGDRLLYDDLTFSLPPGGIVGVIGPNGVGKTTLFRMIMGQEEPDEGSFRVGETVSIGYVDQSRPLDPDKTVYEEISEGAEVIEIGRHEMNARAYVGRFAFSGRAQQKKTGELSGGERNRVHLAKTLKAGANVLLVDEPTNDLDVNTLRAFEEALLDFAGCAVVISHDRWFLDRVATHILAFETDADGRVEVRWFPGNYSEYEADRRARLGPAADVPKRVKYRQLTR